MDEFTYWYGVEIGLRAAAVISERARNQRQAEAEIREYADKVSAHRDRERPGKAAHGE